MCEYDDWVRYLVFCVCWETLLLAFRNHPTNLSNINHPTKFRRYKQGKCNNNQRHGNQKLKKHTQKKEEEKKHTHHPHSTLFLLCSVSHHTQWIVGPLLCLWMMNSRSLSFEWILQGTHSTFIHVVVPLTSLSSFLLFFLELNSMLVVFFFLPHLVLCRVTVDNTSSRTATVIKVLNFEP